MVTIEHNPTQTQSAQQVQTEQAGMEGPFRKKGKKDGALGVFSKLLAGLISKKAGLKPEGLGMSGTGNPENGVSHEGAGAFPAGRKLRAKEGGGKDRGVHPLALKKGPERKEQKDLPQNDVFGFPLLQTPAQNPGGLQGQPEGNEAFQGTEAADVFLASFSPPGETAGTGRNSPEPRTGPFVPGRLPAGNEVRNAAFQAEVEVKNQEKAKTENRETKKTGQRRERPSLTVRDLRTQAGTGAEAEALRPDFRGPEKILHEREIALELRPALGGNGGTGNAGNAGEWEPLPAGQNFEQLLARELRGELSQDIVRQAAIVLRDGGEGTIRLSLKPETLGKVKIHLEMAENKITGHIVVENEEALRAFEQEIHTLEEAFRDSGFAEANLNTALDYRNGGQQWKEDEARAFFSQRFAAAGYDAGSAMDTEELSGGYVSDSAYAVNVLV